METGTSARDGAAVPTEAPQGRALTFTEVETKAYKDGSRKINARFTYPGEPFQAEVEYSFDGVNWVVGREKVVSGEDAASVGIIFESPENAQEGGLIWDVETHPTLYLCVRWPTAPQIADRYSDVLMISGGGMTWGPGGDRDLSGELPLLPEEPDTAASWPELGNWLNDNAGLGGTLALTADITVPAGTYFELSLLHDTVLELGGHTITVEGDLRLYGNLTITGEGGDQGLLRVATGGMLVLDAQYGSVTVTAQSGFALRQEEGGALGLDEGCAVTGEVQYAGPVVCSLEDNPLTLLVEPGVDGAAVLPTQWRAEVNRQGRSADETVTVNWDLTAEEVAEALAERRRVTLTGTVVGMAALETPRCTLAFHDLPITFTDVTAQEGKTYRQISAWFTSPTVGAELVAEYSFDGETWLEAATLDATEDRAEESLSLYFWKPEVLEDHPSNEGDLIWDAERHPDLYLSLRWPEAKGGAWGVFRYADHLRRLPGGDPGPGGTQGRRNQRDRSPALPHTHRAGGLRFR